MERIRDAYFQEWMCGMCVVVHDGNADKDVLVPIERFKDGETKFGYIEGCGATLPCHELNHKQTLKVLAMIQQYDKKIVYMHELRELDKKRSALRNKIADECPNFEWEV